MLTDLRVFFSLVGLTIAGLGGLFMAAKAELQSSYLLGLAVFFIAVIAGGILIRGALDRSET